MKIRAKLTLTFFVIVITILSIVTTSIYFFFADYRKNDFYRRLKNRAINTATLLVEGEEEGVRMLKRIESGSPVNLPQQHIFVYDSDFKQLYSSEALNLAPVDDTLLEQISSNDEVRLEQDNYEILGFKFEKSGTEYFVVAAAHDVYGYDALSNLRNILSTVFAASLIFVSVAGYLYASRFLKPITEIITNVQNITEANLDTRLHEGSTSDELDKLAQTFNNVLARLEQSFNAQKNFISNASHELRTPIAVISAEIEAALMNSKAQDQHYHVLRSILENTKKLAHLSSQLLLLAQTSAKLSDQGFSVARLDEILWEVKTELEHANPGYTITINFDISLNHKSFEVNVDPSLVKVVFANLIDNACKYSNNATSIVSLNSVEESLHISFENTGAGIETHDQQNIFQPFFRGRKTQHIKGYGIGLSLVDRILKLHNGTIKVESIPNGSTKFLLTFPLAGK